MNNKRKINTKVLLLGSLISGLFAVSAAALADDTAPDMDAPVAFSSDPSDPVKVKTAHDAKERGFYVRGQAGYDWIGGGKSKKKDDKATTFPMGPAIDAKASRGVMGRVAAGYDINRYFAVEGGFSMLHAYSLANGPKDGKSGGTTYPISSNGGTTYPMPSGGTTYPMPSDGDGGSTYPISSASSIKTSMYVFDLMGKVKYPIGHFFAFGGAGAAYVHQKATLNGDKKAFSTGGAIRPKLAAGVGYALNDKLSMDVEYSRIIGKGDLKDVSPVNSTKPAIVGNPDFAKKFLPSTNTVAVGLTYKF